MDTASKLQGGEEGDIVMGLASDNQQSLISSLTHLYANPALAALREYCANAADAHKSANQTKPFEVDYKFSKTKGTLRIRDYGHGLNREQLTTIYSQYGATTKHQTNLLAGGFGLGAKSGLAVSNNFFLNTVNNGVLIEAEILKTDSGVATLRVISETSTKKASGTEIIVPLTENQFREISSNAEAQLMGYHPEQVTINGSPHTYSIYNEDYFIPITVGNTPVAHIEIHQNETRLAYDPNAGEQPKLSDAFSVVMGGVYYPTLPSSGTINRAHPEYDSLMEYLNHSLSESSRVVLNVPVGTVDLPPHRDSLIDTEKTWKTLFNLLLNVRTAIPLSTQRYLNSQDLEGASWLVGTMPSLFLPVTHTTVKKVRYTYRSHTWEHRGKKYDNELSAYMEKVPYYITQKNVVGYGSFVNSEDAWLEGKVKAAHFYDLHKGTLMGRGLDAASPVTTVSLSIPMDKYDEYTAYLDAQNMGWEYAKIANRKPSISRFVNGTLLPWLRAVRPTLSFNILLIPEGVEYPEHFRSTIRETFTMSEVKELYRAQFPPKKRSKVSQSHARVLSDEFRWGEIKDSEKIVHFGGKGNFGMDSFIEGNKSYALSRLRSVSTGEIKNLDSFNWIQEGLVTLIGEDESLVLVGASREPETFQKSFPTAVSLASVVKTKYEEYDDAHKLAVQHAFSLVTTWKIARKELIFHLMKDHAHLMENESFRIMFSEPEILSMAFYLSHFKDSHVAGFTEWKKELVEEMEGKALASTLLLPVQALMMFAPSYGKVGKGTNNIGISNKLGMSEADNILNIKTLVEYINKLS